MADEAGKNTGGEPGETHYHTPSEYPTAPQPENTVDSNVTGEWTSTPAGTPTVAPQTYVPVLLPISGLISRQQFALSGGETVIGRNSSVAVHAPDPQLSRRHARIVWENADRDREFPRCFIEDLQSRNGTFVNRRRIQREHLNDGDRILVGNILLGFFINDSAELDFGARLLSHALTDHLTGLANRVNFEEEAQRILEAARATGRPLSLCVADIDQFKEINDSHGHLAGDQVLRGVASLLAATIRRRDFVGRIGGDEFAILLPDSDSYGARDAMEKMCDRVAAHTFRLEGVEEPIRVTLSVGVAQMAPQHDEWQALFKEADEALFCAKREGRNRVSVALPDVGTEPHIGAE